MPLWNAKKEDNPPVAADKPKHQSNGDIRRAFDFKDVLGT